MSARPSPPTTVAFDERSSDSAARSRSSSATRSWRSSARPVAHEDDAQRAVFSALRIPPAIEELNETNRDLPLAVRIGVETGRRGRLRRFGDVRPGHRHRRRGQHGVSAAGRRADRRDPRGRGNAPAHEGSVRLRAARSGTGQGQGRAAAASGSRRAARSRFGAELQRGLPTPFVGREDELELLKHTFARAVPRAFGPARHAARRSRGGQEPHHPRAVLIPRRPARAGGVSGGTDDVSRTARA